MNNLALDLIEYIKEDADQNQDIKGLYTSLMYALSDGDYLSTLPEQFQDQKVVEDAYDICYARETLLDPGCHYYDDVIPEYLFLKVPDIECYFSDSILSEIEDNIDKVFPDNYEFIESDAIESVIKSETMKNCKEILEDYVEYMKEECSQDLEVYNNHGDPYIVKYGKITERAELDYDKVVEICETAKQKYYHIYFDYKLWK